jgi:SET domain-containing protein
LRVEVNEQKKTLPNSAEFTNYPLLLLHVANSFYRAAAFSGRFSHFFTHGRP